MVIWAFWWLLRLFLGCFLVVKNIWVVAWVVTRVFGVVADQLLNCSVLKLSWLVLASTFFLKMQIPIFFLLLALLKHWIFGSCRPFRDIRRWFLSGASPLLAQGPFMLTQFFCKVSFEVLNQSIHPSERVFASKCHVVLWKINSAEYSTVPTGIVIWMSMFFS